MKNLTFTWMFPLLSNHLSMKFLFIIFYIPSLLLGQSQFQHMVGGPAGFDYAFGVSPTSDGGYVAAGTTSSFGNGWDVYVVKVDGAGTPQWTKTIGGPADDDGASVVQTSDGGYVIVGDTRSYGVGGDYDVYIVKLDVTGSLQWTKTIGGTFMDVGSSIIQTLDGGYAVAGFTESYGAGSRDAYIAKMDAAGNLQWTKTIGGTAADWAYSIVQNTDGGYTAAGYTKSYGAGDADVYIMQLDGSGNLQWTKTIGGTNTDEGHYLIHTADGGYAVTGYTKSYGAGSDDVYVIKLDGAGSLQWTKTIGGPSWDDGNAIVQANDGGYVIAGITYSFGAGLGDVYVVKLDASGTLQSTQTFGGANDEDYAWAITKTTDGGYLVVGDKSKGVSDTDIYLIKLDNNSNTCGTNMGTGGVAGMGGTLVSGAGVVGSGGVVNSGGVAGSGGVLTAICPPVGISEQLVKNNQIDVFPNPSFDGMFSVNYNNFSSGLEAIVFNAYGEEIMRKNMLNENEKINLSSHPNGIYFIRLFVSQEEGKHQLTSKKLIINR